MKTPPLYLRIREDIRNSIAAGEYQAGEKIPSEAELCRKYGTTRATTRKALSQLVFEGMIAPRNGRGCFVAPGANVRSPIDSRYCLTFEEQVKLTGRVVTYGSGSLTVVPAPTDAAARLGAKEGEKMFKLERVRLIDGEAIGLEIRYIPFEIGCKITGDMLSNASTHQFISEILGERLPTIVVDITAVLAEPEVAKKLNVPVGSPLIMRVNSIHSDDGRARACGQSIYRGNVSTEYVLGKPLDGGYDGTFRA
jgi:GntR family transcriptional regulator